MVASATVVYSLMLLRVGKTLDLGLPDWVMATYSMPLPLTRRSFFRVAAG
jgi:hypothetical protein